MSLTSDNGVDGLRLRCIKTVKTTGQVTDGGPCLLRAAELLVGDVGGQVGVQHGAECQPVVPAAAEVGDVDVLENTNQTNKHKGALVSRVLLRLYRQKSGRSDETD